LSDAAEPTVRRTVQSLPLEFSRCLDCGLIYQTPRLTRESLSSYFSSETFIQDPNGDNLDELLGYPNYFNWDKSYAVTAELRLDRIGPYRIRASLFSKRAAVRILRQNCRILEAEGYTEGALRDWFGKCDNPADRARYCVRDLSQDSLFDPASPFRSSFCRGAADARCIASGSRGSVFALISQMVWKIITLPPPAR
jgi:hypothetical protein